MQNSLIKITDEQKTAWYESDSIRQISDAAELLSMALRTNAAPDVEELEQCAGDALHPVTQEEYAGMLQGFFEGPDDGLLVEIDMAASEASFTYWANQRPEAYQIYAPVEKVAEVFEQASDPASGELDTARFFCDLVGESDWHATTMPAEHFAGEEQSVGFGMAMM